MGPWDPPYGLTMGVEGDRADGLQDAEKALGIMSASNPGRVREETRQVTFFVWECPDCGRALEDQRRTLLDLNITQHRQRHERKRAALERLVAKIEKRRGHG